VALWSTGATASSTVLPALCATVLETGVVSFFALVEPASVTGSVAFSTVWVTAAVTGATVD
jgi:hypothetical protein